MDITLAGSAITYRPNDDQLGGLSLEFAAFDGEVGIGQVPVPDPSASVSVYDGRACKVDEGAALLIDGYIVDQDRERGPMPAGTARLHTFSVMDANCLLDGFRVEETRPAETDYARVIAFAALDGPAWDTSMVINANTVTLPAKTYASDGGWTGELIPDLVEFTGKTLWLHDKRDGSGRCLHYHNLTSGHACGLAISDQTPNGPVTWNPWEPRRQRTSVDLRNDIKMTDQAGRTATVTDSASISAHDPDGLQHQALISVEADSQADLNVKAAALLASTKDERDTYTCTIGPLDEDALLLIRAGDLIPVTSSVMGLSASTQRIAHMTLRPVIGEGGRAAEGLWFADLELGAPVRRRARVANKVIVGDTVEDLPPWKCAERSLRILWTGSGGDGFVVLPTPYGDAASTETCKLYAGSTYRVDYTVYHSATSNQINVALIATTGPLTAFASAYMGGHCGGGAYDIFASRTFVAPAGDRDFHVVIQSQFFDPCPSQYSSVEARVYYVSGSDPRFYGLSPCTNGEPHIGQWVAEGSFTGDGTTTAFTTVWPYLPETLVVWVNGLSWTSLVTETDPTTGAYTIPYPFPTGATVNVTYRRAT